MGSVRKLLGASYILMFSYFFPFTSCQGERNDVKENCHGFWLKPGKGREKGGERKGEGKGRERGGERKGPLMFSATKLFQQNYFIGLEEKHDD